MPSRIFSLDASYAFRTTCVLAAMGRLRAMAARPLMLIPATPATPPMLWPLEERPRSWLWLWLVGATEGATKAQAARPLPTATESFDIDGIFCMRVAREGPFEPLKMSDEKNKVEFLMVLLQHLMHPLQISRIFL